MSSRGHFRYSTHENVPICVHTYIHTYIPLHRCIRQADGYMDIRHEQRAIPESVTKREVMLCYAMLKHVNRINESSSSAYEFGT